MKILNVISEIYKVPISGLTSKRGAHPLPEARHLIIWYLVRCEDWTLTSASKVVNTGTSNAIISYHNVENMRNTDKQIRDKIHELLIRMQDEVSLKEVQEWYANKTNRTIDELDSYDRFCAKVACDFANR